MVDLRKPPKNIEVLMEVMNIKVPVVAILSTDAATGKNIVMMELAKEAEKRGFKVGAVATGQTMMLVRGDAGAAHRRHTGRLHPWHRSQDDCLTLQRWERI